MDADGTQITATRTYYDGEPEEGLPLGQLDARGIVARVETWLEADTWVPTLRQTNDARGNIIRVRDAEDGTSSAVSTPPDLFPVEERVHLATASSSQRPSGTRASVIPSRSQLRTAPPPSSTFDGLGRLTAEILPGDT
jgi:hypothetical protein